MKTAFVPLSAWLLVCVAPCLCVPAPALAAEATKFTEKDIYSFCPARGCFDGENPDPSAGLTVQNGTLYGTTQIGGGGSGCGEIAWGCGTVFALDPDTGVEKVLHAFCTRPGCPDGAFPDSLVAVNGAARGLLVGTTRAGGRAGCSGQGCGTIFALKGVTLEAKALYAFAGATDGSGPNGVIGVNGVLYGTTITGGGTGCGGAGCGTVFSLDPNTGTENVLYSFCGKADCADGQWPDANLTAAGGKLYGTTESGGRLGCGGSSRCGTVFAIDLKTGAETTLYSFCNQTGCTDGAVPQAGMIDVRGMLFGTTFFGGERPCQNMPPGCGALFVLDPDTGTEKVLYSFCRQHNCSDGEHPGSSLIDVGGALYGTTSAGGSQNAGTAFAFDLSTGTETAFASFCGSNCDDPSSLIDVGGNLFGTLAGGGTGTGCGPNPGCGLVFELEEIH